MRMRYFVVCAAALMVAGPAFAASLDISLGVRETNYATAPGTFGIAGSGGGNIENFGLGAQALDLNDTWQQFSFDVSSGGLAYGGVGSVTGDGILTSSNSVLEHVRIGGGIGGKITMWIDNISISYDPAGPQGLQVVPISTFDVQTGGAGAYADGTEVMFQEPGFSGSTSGNLLAGINFSGIDNSVGQDDTHSVMTEFKYVDNSSSRWLRYTTFGGGAGWQPERNPVIAEAYSGGLYDSATLTFWMKGIPEPGTLALLAFGGLGVLRRRR